MSPGVLPALALAFNALVWGLSWWPLRELQQLGLHPLWATAGVYLLAVLCVLVFQARALRVVLHSPALWLLALASGFTNAGFNWAVTIEDVVRVVLLFYLMPAWAVVLAWLALGERPSALALARVGLALAGVLLVLKTPQSPWPWPVSLGDWLSIAGGASFALTNILLRQQNQTPAPARALAMFGGGMVLAGAAALWGGANGLVPAPPQLAIAWVLGLLALGLVLLAGNLALQYGAARLAAQTTALVMVLEVVFASASSVLLGVSALSWQVVLGASLILAAALWAARSER